MSTAVERFDDGARARFGAHGRTFVRENELLRHPVYSRVLHWSVAAFFILALLSGLAIYTPWLYRVLTPLFGGGPMTRLLHPWFSLGFVAFFALQLLNWLQPMSWTPDDTRWLRRLKEYVANTDKLEPEYVDFFNAGQKLYFWAIVGSSVIFLISGVPMWFPRAFGRTRRPTSANWNRRCARRPARGPAEATGQNGSYPARTSSERTSRSSMPRSRSSR